MEIRSFRSITANNIIDYIISFYIIFIQSIIIITNIYLNEKYFLKAIKIFTNVNSLINKQYIFQLDHYYCCCFIYRHTSKQQYVMLLQQSIVSCYSLSVSNQTLIAALNLSLGAVRMSRWLGSSGSSELCSQAHILHRPLLIHRERTRERKRKYKVNEYTTAIRTQRLS